MQAFALPSDKTVSYLDVNLMTARRAGLDLHQQCVYLRRTRLNLPASEPITQQIDLARFIQCLHRFDTQRVTRGL